MVSWKAGANMFSGPGRLLEVEHCINSVECKPHIVFWLVLSKISCTNIFNSLIWPILPLCEQNTHLGSLLKVSGSVVGFNQPTRAWKHTGGANFSGYQRVILADLEAQERKFVANSRLKKAEKINFSWNLVPIKTVLLLPFILKDPIVYM